MRFAVGTRFLPRRKNSIVYTVVDYYETRNLAGAVVKVEYLCHHEFLGQIIATLEPETSIAIGVDLLTERVALNNWLGSGR